MKKLHKNAKLLILTLKNKNAKLLILTQFRTLKHDCFVGNSN